jgi:hypothetical protein
MGSGGFLGLVKLGTSKYEHFVSQKKIDSLGRNYGDHNHVDVGQ